MSANLSGGRNVKIPHCFPILLLAAALLQGAAAYAQPPSDAAATLRPVFPELRFERPLAMLRAPGGGAHWYVVEQRGLVWRVAGEGEAAQRSVFVDIRGRVDDGPNEAGLLGMALHPDFARNGEVFLSYTADGAPLVSRVARYRLRGDGRTLDPASEEILLAVAQPFGNHNGGHIAFGPDGYLYIGLGDGGAGGDPHGNGQNTETLLGAILRIDVDGARPYAIPRDNPFAGGGGGRPEVYAWGLRNPWRWSFDPATGDLWAGDVGQNAWEEVDVIRKGGNYGWNIREGAHCYASATCDKDGLIEPVAEYRHPEGCSITGGHVYHGRDLPALAGAYLFGDYCSGRIWALRDGATRVLLESDLAISSFARDAAGEIYVLDHRGGGVYRLAPQ